MPRQSRLDAPGTLHHVIGLGIEGSKIFWDRGDREDFLARLAKLCEAKALSVYSWALLDTHFHLLVRGKKGDVGKEGGRWFKRKLLLTMDLGRSNFGSCQDSRDWMHLGPYIT